MTHPKGFSFATMMVLAQRRHAARMASVPVLTPASAPAFALVLRGDVARASAQKTKGTNRLVTRMYSV
ncbi:MAG: hypothetical protein ABI605_16145 [Rhizobacter sp.]